MKEYQSGFLKAEDLDPNVRYEATITGVGVHDFEDTGERKPYVDLDILKKCVLNQTRLTECGMAWGWNSDLWIGQKIIVIQGETPYGGKMVPCIVFEPITTTRLAAEPARPQIATPPAQPRRAVGRPTDVRRGHATWRDQEPPPPPPRDEYAGPSDDPSAA
jgi:hypothetical protein